MKVAPVEIPIDDDFLPKLNAIASILGQGWTRDGVDINHRYGHGVHFFKTDRASQSDRVCIRGLYEDGLSQFACTEGYGTMISVSQSRSPMEIAKAIGSRLLPSYLPVHQEATKRKKDSQPTELEAQPPKETRLIILDQSKIDRWSKAAIKELSPRQQRYLDSMLWHGYTIGKARLSGSKNDLVIALERVCVLLENPEADQPKPMGISEELREYIVAKNGKVSKGRRQFKWTPESSI